jgi:hypothetical protein
MAAGVVEAHVVPLDVSTFPEVLGATTCSALVPLPNKTLFAVRVVAPVPPLATTSVPAKVNVPEVVIGLPLNVIPVVPPLAATLVTPPAVGVVEAHVVPSEVRTFPEVPGATT